MIMSLLQVWPKKCLKMFPLTEKKIQFKETKNTFGLGEKWQILTSYHSYKYMSSITQVTVKKINVLNNFCQVCTSIR